MWSEHQKGLYLAVSLIGQAQAVLGDLPKEKRQIFSDLVNALEERFAPSSQTELYRVQFKECRQKASETLPGLGQSVRRLSNLAYPTAPLELRDTLAKEQFIDALVDSEMRLRIKQSRPKELQSNDSDLKLVKRWLTEGQRPQYSEVSGRGYFIRSLWSQFGCLEVHGDVVVRRHMDCEFNVVKLQAVIPMSERKQVLQCCHETKFSSHLGIHKTIEKIRQSFYWPGLQSDVRTYVAGCNQCTMRKRSMKRKRVSWRLEDNGRHESKRPACMAYNVNK
ncbi:Hypothetical predicted protein [Mytilus galloprovincialis]|uniref:Integrase zinc-binding domain-containing protein n=1 Tax=Mytilus galloprovincialis TaxID=29158 RepID=A0A8B6GDM4_MYTGA|nr:Hypothetical predicted protein [Mytilus galloprovincialis]